MNPQKVATSIGKLLIAIALVFVFMIFFGLLPPVEKWQVGPTVLISVGILSVALLVTFLRAEQSSSASSALKVVLKKFGKGLLIVLVIVLLFNVLFFLTM
jgi:amino acid transporter